MSSCIRRVLSVSVPILLLAAAPAQWRRSLNNVLPPSVNWPSLAPMPDGDLFFFGGVSANDWLWSGTHWSPITTPIPRRDRHAIAVHRSSGDVILQGGAINGQFIPDMWRFDGTSWQQVTTATAPTPLVLNWLGFDPVSDDMVLVGTPGVNVWETWRYDGIDWSPSQATLPSNTNAVSMYTDTVRGVLTAFLFTSGGIEVMDFVDDDWQLRATHNGPVSYGEVAFDPVRGRAVYFESHPTTAGTTFEYDGLTLRQFPLNVGVPLIGKDLAYDARRGEVVMVNTFGAIFSWNAQPAPFATAYGDPCVDPAFTLGLVPGSVPSIGAVHRLQAGATSGAFTFAVAGFSHTMNGGQLLPLPIPGTGCEQRVQSLLTSFLGTMPAQLDITVPNDPLLLGVRYDVQFVAGNVGGVVDVSNGLEVQIGLPAPTNALVESFDNDLQRDPEASGDRWFAGTATPVSLGGDGRHGAFEASAGTPTSLNVWQWSTDSQLIAASSTLSGTAVTVTDGRFFFTDLIVPVGTTIDFVGSQPAQLHVRGRVDIAGTLRLNGAAMQPFDARGGLFSNMFVNGQPGGAAGGGGGRGGRGGDECQGTGPIIVGGVTLTDGGDGEDVRLLAGNGYAAQAVGSGGRGAAMNPPSGIAAPNTPLVGFVYRAFFAPGGAGGGFHGAGGTAAVLNTLTNLQVGPAPAAGTNFDIAALSSTGFTSLDHYTIGGSGGGGGSTHAFGTIYVTGDVYIAGSAGSGGGGACAIRSGADLVVRGSLEAMGGVGAVINGRDPGTATNNVNWGVSSPGGGGSGGAFLLQSAAALNVSGHIDTSGGGGSLTANISTASINVAAQAGSGAAGFYRLESALGTTFNGTGVPVYNPATQSGTLADTDDRSGSRSLWLRPATLELPRYLRYELVVDINGSTVLFSDDAAVSGMAADDPNGAVMLRLQGAQLDPLTGTADPTTAGPWRTRATAGPGTLNTDRAEVLRFDLVLDKSQGPIAVRELRVLWR